MEKSTSLKRTGGAQGGSQKVDIVSSFTSQLVALQKYKKGMTSLNQPPRSNAHNRQTGNSGVRTVRSLKTPSGTQKKKGDSRLSRAGRRQRSSGGSLQRYVFNANEGYVTQTKTGPASEPSWVHRFPHGDEATTTTTAKTPSTMQSMTYDNVLDALVQSNEQSAFLISLQNENDVAEREPTTFYNVPSECSSLNSSIPRSPHFRNEIIEDKEIWAEKQQGEGENIPPSTLNGDASEELLPYDEEDEEKAVQQYMGSGEATGALHGAVQNWTSAPKSLLGLMSNVTLEADNVSGRRCFLSSRALLCSRNLPKRHWKERPHQLLSGTSLSYFQCRAERALLDALSDSTCRLMSLYDAFFLDEKRERWLVDDHVLARCLDYVGLMGYQQMMPTQLSLQADLQLPVTLGALTSPVSSSSVDERRFVHGVMLCRWTLSSGKPCSASARSGASMLFVPRQEAERWLSVQEYVLGTILACCAWDDSSSNARENNKKVPYLTPSLHPIRQAAMYALERFSRWEDISNFLETWERQIGIVLGTAAPLHQRVFRFPEEGLVFSSDMESGNLARVERTRNATCQPAFNLWIEPEFKCEQRLWFRFAIAGMRQNCAVCLRVVNIQPNTKLYVRNGMRPVWRAGNSPRQWTPVGQCSYRTINNDADGELTFVLIPRSNDLVHVAFCVPYTYADLLCHVAHWHHLVRKSTCGILFEEHVLCHTQDGRKLHLLIITGSSTKSFSARRNNRGGSVANYSRQSITGPYSHFDTGKKVVLLSGRVHPGEVTASHGIHGVISFLLSRDPHAVLLREHFIFYIVPMLNPDGVARGHSRLDQNGFNLNRCYKSPIPETQPTVNALRKIFECLQQTYPKRFFMYLDFHSHASQSSGFIFGNCLPPTVQHWNLVFPKIVSLHAKDVFSYDLCRFGKGHMTSKEGSSRVLFGGSLIHSYTVELAHFTNNRMFVDGACSDEGSQNSGGAARLAGGVGANGDGGWETRYANTQGRRQGAAGGASQGERTVSSPTSRFRSAQSRKPLSCAQRGGKRSAEKNGRVAKIGTSNGGTVSNSNDGSSEHGSLRHIETVCILSQSAEVGRACLMALLDYCAVKNYVSPQFAMYGGMERALREVKRGTLSAAPVRPSGNRMQFVYKLH